MYVWSLDVCVSFHPSRYGIGVEEEGKGRGTLGCPDIMIVIYKMKQFSASGLICVKLSCMHSGVLYSIFTKPKCLQCFGVASWPS